MKKKILIAASLVIAIIVAVLLYAAFNASAIVAKYKPEIERQASQALGAPVSLGDLSVNVFPSAAIELEKLTVGGGAGEEPLTLEDLTFRVGLLPLLKGSVKISELSLADPNITVIRDKDGVRIPGLPRPKNGPPPAEAPVTPPQSDSGAVPQQSPKAALPEAITLRLDRFSLTGGKILFKDEVAAKQYSVSEIEVRSAVALDGGVIRVPNFEISAALLDKVPLVVRGSGIEFDSAAKSLKLGEVEGGVAGNQVNLAGNLALEAMKGNVKLTSAGIDISKFSDFAQIIPAIAAFQPSGTVVPNFSVDLLGTKDYNLRGEISLRALSAKIGEMQINDGSGKLLLSSTPALSSLASNDLRLSLGGEPVAIKLDAALEGTRAAVRALNIEAFSGKIDLAAQLALDAAKAFSADMQISGVKIGPALAAVKPSLPAVLDGTVERIALQLSGAASGDDLPATISGNGDLALKDATLKGINLAGDLLRAVNSLPFVNGSLYQHAPQSERGALDSPDTVISSLRASYSIGGKKLTTPDLSMQSPLFGLTAKGSAGFDGMLDLAAAMAFNQKFSASIVGAVKETKALLNSSEQLVVPLRLQGVAPKLVLLPDVQKLLESAGKRALQDKAGKALESLTKGGKFNFGF